MPQKFWIVPVPKRPTFPGGPVDPGYGIDEGEPTDPGYVGGEEPPTVGGGPLPPLPGVWPPPGRPVHLPAPSPPTVENPIVIPGDDPAHPIELPPGSVWPPLPPDFDHGGKKAILIWVVGVGKRWFVYDPSQRPQPKGR